MITYPEALLWTYALEAPLVLAAGWRWHCGAVRTVAAALLASGLTHPVAWRVAEAMTAHAYARWGWYAVEAAVMGAEALILGRVMRLSAGRAWGLSVLANGVSALVGRFVL